MNTKEIEEKLLKEIDESLDSNYDTTEELRILRNRLEQHKETKKARDEEFWSFLDDLLKLEKCNDERLIRTGIVYKMQEIKNSLHTHQIKDVANLNRSCYTETDEKTLEQGNKTLVVESPSLTDDPQTAPKSFLERAEKLEEKFKFWKNEFEITKTLAYEIRVNQIIKEAKALKEEILKEYRSLKREHCDDCGKEECPTCKPEFDKIREALEKVNKIQNKEKGGKVE